MEELVYSYIRHMEDLATDILRSANICDTDYERVIAEHRLFARRIAASQDLPPPIKDRCAALRLPRRPALPKDWRSLLRLLEWLFRGTPRWLDESSPHLFYAETLRDYIAGLGAMRQAAFFSFNGGVAPQG